MNLLPFLSSEMLPGQSSKTRHAAVLFCQLYENEGTSIFLLKKNKEWTFKIKYNSSKDKLESTHFLPSFIGTYLKKTILNDKFDGVQKSKHF